MPFSAYYHTPGGESRQGLTEEQVRAALAIACNNFNLQCKVYMVCSSYEEKPYGRAIMEILGAEVVSSPSPHTRAGQKALARDAEDLFGGR